MTAQTKTTLPIAKENSTPLPRFQSADLFQNTREIEIEHNGRVYRMRMTHLNKLILTA